MNTDGTVFLLAQKGVGHGPEERQMTLMNNYIELLDLNGELLSAICFYTKAVKLATGASPVMD
jgi:hypothetical protein